MLDNAGVLPAQTFARHLLSGAVGCALYHDLIAQFPDIGREDAFLGIALAWTEMQASLLACEAEILAAKSNTAAT